MKLSFLESYFLLQAIVFYIEAQDKMRTNTNGGASHMLKRTFVKKLACFMFAVVIAGIATLTTPICTMEPEDTGRLLIIYDPCNEWDD